jgi:2-iminobutanoate/2-iminopropanoate deaminase
MRYIFTREAPEPAGHYSQAVLHGGLIYISGQVPRYWHTTTECPDSIEEQTHLVLSNMSAILAAADSGIDRVIKMNVYLTDMEAWGKVNEVYSAFFAGHRPARTVVPVPVLRYRYRIEIDAVAAVRGFDDPS